MVRTCAGCGVAFEAGRSDKRYHSRKCYSHAQYQADPDGRKAQVAEWRRNNPEAVNRISRRNAQRRKDDPGRYERHLTAERESARRMRADAKAFRYLDKLMKEWWGDVLLACQNGAPLPPPPITP